MDFKTFGDIRLPVLGIGTWGMGGYLNIDNTRDREWIIAIRTAIEWGFIHIDTAELYGLGHTEELVAQAIKGFDRNKIFITTKGGSNLEWTGGWTEKGEVIAAAEGSLKRLQIDYIDLYLIHVPNKNLAPIMEGMNELVERTLTRYIGVSNFSVNEMREAQRNSENKIIANQVEYNLLTRNNAREQKNVESQVIPYCQEHDMIVAAHTPLARGGVNKPGLGVLDKIAEKYGKTYSQVALAWLISKKNVIALPKAANLEHLEDNLGAVGWMLDPMDIEELDKEYDDSLSRHSVQGKIIAAILIIIFLARIFQMFQLSMI